MHLLLFFLNSSLIANLKPVAFNFCCSTNTWHGCNSRSTWLASLFRVPFPAWAPALGSLIFPTHCINPQQCPEVLHRHFTVHIMAHGVPQCVCWEDEVLGVQVQNCFFKHSDRVVQQTGCPGRFVCLSALWSIISFSLPLAVVAFASPIRECDARTALFCLMAACGKAEHNLTPQDLHFQKPSTL